MSAELAKPQKELPVDELPKEIIIDGQKVPVGLPPNMPVEQYKAAVEFLQKNPEVAKQHVLQAQQMMQNPYFAASMAAVKKNMSDPDYQQRLNGLKEDPELKGIFDEIEKGGQEALSKYWNDKDLMARISRKLGGVPTPTAAPNRPAPGKPAVIKTLHEAGQYNEIKRGKELIDQGADVNAKDARGITALGVAVGFNRIAMVKLLLDAKCDVNATDAKGNTALHYAAGYSRPEISKMLLDAGADINAVNNDKQTPLDVALMNGENGMAKKLEERGAKKFDKANNALFVN